MKSILWATTALVATAGVAVAQQESSPNIGLTGFAEFGVYDPGDDDGEVLQFNTDIDVTFTMAIETDTGLQFGASIDLDESDPDDTITGLAVNRAGDDVGGATVDEIEDEVVDTDGDGLISADEFDAFREGQDDPIANLAAEDIEIGGSPAFDGDKQGGETIFISGPFGTLTMGDTDGAFDWALEEAIIGSAIADDHEHDGYSGNSGLDGAFHDGQVFRYERTLAGFGVAVSAEIDDEGEQDPSLGIGARYSTSFGSFRGNPIGIGLGLGYQRLDAFDPIDDIGDAVDDITGDDEDEDEDTGGEPEIYGVSADIDLGGGLRAIVNYSNGDDVNEDGADFEHYGVAVGYTFDQVTVAANYGRFNRDDELVTEDDDGVALAEADQFFEGRSSDGFGVIVNYDLGAGAVAQFGYGNSSNDDPGTDDDETYSLGIAISF